MLGAEELWAQATGGSSVAADPDTASEHLVEGPYPPGVSEACEWMRLALSDPASSPHFLFLVGGPGGGKSRAAAELLEDFTPTDAPDDGLVRRTYRYELPGRDLILVNDATIDQAPETANSGRSGLSEDVDRAIQAGSHLIACVNRGVLFDELAGQAPIHDLIPWLAEGSSGGDGESAFLRQSAVGPPDGGAIRVVAVYVDVCSLLEGRAPTDTSSAGDLKPHGYQLMGFNGDRSATPAGSVIADVMRQFTWDSQMDSAIDPVRANLESLRQEAVLGGLLRVMRAGEIVSGQRFTYREVWGLLARVVAGELPQSVRPIDAEAALVEVLPSDGQDPSFTELQELAQHRWFVALFGGLNPAPDRAFSDPVLRITAGADPLFDASPAWAGPVIDAFASSVLTSSPLDEVRAALPEGCQGAVQPFDESLDRAFSLYCQDITSVASRAEAESWYGRYLTRLYATATGVPAFREAVEEWVNSYRQAPAVSDALNPLLRTLLSPRRFANPDASPLVPLYASRTDPILGYVDEPTLALRAAPFQFNTKRDGEDLRLTVKEDGVPVGEVLLDFDMVREAFACSRDWLGMTEASDHISPRVERFRSRRLTSSALARSGQLAVALGDADFLISVDRKHHGS